MKTGNCFRWLGYSVLMGIKLHRLAVTASVVYLAFYNPLGAAIYCDNWLSMANQPVGSTLTTTMLDAGTVGNKTVWGLTPSTPTGFTVAAHQIDLHPRILVKFAGQPPGQNQRALALDNTHNFTFAEGGFNIPTGVRVMNYFGWIKLGPAEITNGQIYDLNGIYTDSPAGYAIMQLRNGTGPNYALNVETDGSGTLLSAYIPVVRNTWYWFNLRGNWNSGVAELWVYNVGGTLVGHVTVQQKTGADIRRIRVGNMEIGTSAGTTYWQDLGVDYTYADYVPLANDGNVVPADRAADWNNAGFAVPNVTTVYTTLPTTATYSDVMAALTACPANQAVVLAPGTHTWTGIVDFGSVGNGKVLRGTQVNGANATTVNWSGTRAVRMWNYPDETKLAVDLNVTANIRKGDTKIVVGAVPSWCQPGLLLGIDQLNDEVFSSVNTGREAAGIYRARPNAGSNGDRGQGEIVLIAATTATTISTVHPILHDYSVGRTAQIFMPYYDMTVPSKAPRTMCGIENIDFVGSGGAVTDAHTIIMDSCYKCWVTGCGSFTSKSTHIFTQFIYQCVFSGNYCYDSSTFAAGQGYGITLYDLSCRNLVENNIVRRSRASYQINYGSCGNVFAYNYALESHSDSGEGPELHIHGNSADYNLFEGNCIDGKAMFDCIHGSSYANTLFRNRLMGSVTTEIQSGNANNQIALDVDYWNRDCVVVGNVCGTAGWHDLGQLFAPNSCTSLSKYVYKWGFVNAWAGDATYYDTYAALNPVFHGNYDTVTNGIIWDPSITNHAIPNSLYLAAKPAWFGSHPWPAYDPANPTAATVTNIPSGDRYVNVISNSTTPPAAPTNLHVVP